MPIFTQLLKVVILAHGNSVNDFLWYYTHGTNSNSRISDMKQFIFILDYC